MNLRNFVVAAAFLALVINCSQPSDPGDNLDDQYSVYLTGFVLDQDGNPVANTVAVVKGTALSDTTGADGSYLIVEEKHGSSRPAPAGDSVAYLKAGQVITMQNIPKWIDTLPDIFIVQRDIFGHFSTAPASLSRITATITGDGIPAASPLVAVRGYISITQNYSGYVYFVYSGALRNYSVVINVYNSDSVLIGRSLRVDFASNVGDVQVPDFDPNNNMPLANAGNDIHVAKNSMVTLHGTATKPVGSIVKWEWNINNSGFVQTSSGDTAITTPDSVIAAYECVLRVTDNDNFTAVDTVALQVGIPAPTLVSPENGRTDIYSGDPGASVMLTADGSIIANAYVFQISNDSDFSSLTVDYTYSSSEFNIPSAPLMQGTTYYWRVCALHFLDSTLTVTDSSDWSEVWSFSTMYAPVITSQPVSQTVYEGDSVIFSVVASGNPLPTYQWWTVPGFKLMAITSTGSYTINAATSSDSGDYFVFVSNARGSVTSNTFTCSVNRRPSAPVITAQLQISPSSIVAAGNSALFWLFASGYPAPTYEWWRLIGGMPTFLAATTSNSYKIDTVKSSDSGAYFVIVSNGIGGPVTSDTVSLFLSPSAPVLVSPADSATGVSTKPTLTWNASSGSVAQYYFDLWDSHGNHYITWTTGTSYVPSSLLSPSTTYYWRVLARNAYGGNYSAVWSFTTAP